VATDGAAIHHATARTCDDPDDNTLIIRMGFSSE